jgi:hypothetical protein
LLGESFLIFNNDGSDPVDWAFASRNGRTFYFGGNALDEGSRFIVDDSEFAISFFGGDGNDIVLYAVPEPTGLSLLLGMASAALGLGRRRFRG